MAHRLKHTIGCGLIGAGAWGSLLAAELVRVPHLALVGVADAAPERARAVADRFSAIAFPSIADALAHDAVEAVVIAVPNDQHAETALAAIAAGKHVLLEKPMALTVHDADRVASAARAAGIVLMLDHIQRYYSPLLELKRLVERGTLGNLQAVFVSRRDHLVRTKPWLQQRRHVGGLLYQSACHEFDFLRWLCGEVVEIACLAGPGVIARDTLDYPDVIVSQLRFASGVAGQVWSCMTDPLMGYDGVVTGSRGSAWFDLYQGRLRWRTIGGEIEERTWVPADGWAPWAWIASGGIGHGEAEALQALLADFARALGGDGGPAVTGQDGAKVVELAQAGYLSLVARRPVGVPLIGSDRRRATYLEVSIGSARGKG